MKPQILPHGKAQANTAESGVTPEKNAPARKRAGAQVADARPNNGRSRQT
mgnify:FL=1